MAPHTIQYKILLNIYVPPQKLKDILKKKNWEMTSSDDAVTRFMYATDQHQITASPDQISGPGWEAAIDGQQAVSVVVVHLYVMQV